MVNTPVPAPLVSLNFDDIDVRVTGDINDINGNSFNFNDVWRTLRITRRPLNTVTVSSVNTTIAGQTQTTRMILTFTQPLEADLVAGQIQMAISGAAPSAEQATRLPSFTSPVVEPLDGTGASGLTERRVWSVAATVPAISGTDATTDLTGINFQSVGIRIDSGARPYMTEAWTTFNFTRLVP